MGKVMRSATFLHEYLNSCAPVGREVSGQAVWLRYLKPYVDDYFTDSYGNAVAVINPAAEYKVVIEAHADEIAWYVKYISPEGYLYVTRNGGSDYEIAPSMHAKIYSEQGKVFPAVFGWPAIHTRRQEKAEQPKPSAKTIVLDGGFASQKEVLRRGIRVGDVVVFDQKLRELNDCFWVGRALDNRMGGFAIAEVARTLHEAKVKLPWGLYLVNAVQEEIGHFGARVVADRIRPDVALVVDACHCTHAPLYSKIRHGEVHVGKGPVLGIAPSLHPNVRGMLAAVAQEQRIAFQRDAAQRTGTDAEAFAFSGRGVPTALLSYPLKYMHTTVEMVHQQDVAQLIQWLYQFVLALPKGQAFDVAIAVS